ncbi:MAG: LacI family DNA-binding transcriptional regulator, partial [Agathobacter rectalis]
MTIVDIAKESGYSVTTVSRVLNNRQDVSPAAKETIMKIVEAHNFVPNTNAKRLKQTISRNIYLLVKGTSNMLFANVVEEIQSIIDRTDYSLSITYLDEDSNLSSVTDRICRERKPLGIIFLGGSREDFSEDTSSFKVPCVIVTTSAENWSMEELSSVSIDDEKAGETIVDYLIEHGHTKIAEIGANLELSQTARLRHNGYLNSLKKHGITPDERYYERARFSYDSAYRAMKKLLEK